MLTELDGSSLHPVIDDHGEGGKQTDNGTVVGVSRLLGKRGNFFGSASDRVKRGLRKHDCGTP